MRNKAILFILTIALSLLTASEARAQKEKGGYTSARLPNGVALLFTTETDPPSSRKQTEGSIYIKGEAIHRILVDREARSYFGYDIEVERVGESNRYKVTIKPLSIEPTINGRQGRSLNGATGRGGAAASAAGERGEPLDGSKVNLTARPLPAYPQPQIVEDGDTLALDLLVNPQTGVKIVDYIKVSSDSDRLQNYSAQSSASGQPARDFTVDAVEMRIKNFQLLVNGETVIGGEKSFQGGLSGPVLWFYIAGRGRFFFSLAPREGFNFQRIAVIEHNKISFTFGGDRYEWISNSAIVGSGGNWNLWVLPDGNYKPDFHLLEPGPVLFGAGDLPEHPVRKD
jgi:hypothetical protein